MAGALMGGGMGLGNPLSPQAAALQVCYDGWCAFFQGGGVFEEGGGVQGE
jgi:hypothetical protein